MPRLLATLVLALAALIVPSSVGGNLASATPAYAALSEITLLAPDGSATAYIAPDEDYTIYLWDGTPAAYLVENDSTSIHVYSFSGTHIGWLENGVVWDHDGNAIAALKWAFSGIPQIEPIKSIKWIKPIRGIREIPPLKPLYSYTWGSLPLTLLLRSTL